MASVLKVAREAKPGDRIAWKGEKADVDEPKPSTVTRVVLGVERITVEADGPRGANVGFWVEADGASEVWHGNHEMGPVDEIEIEEKGDYRRQFRR